MIVARNFKFLRQKTDTKSIALIKTINLPSQGLDDLDPSWRVWRLSRLRFGDFETY